MNRTIERLDPVLIVKFLGALVVGLAVGTIVTSDTVALPVVGPIHATVAGIVGLLIGGLLYHAVPARLDGGGCGCGGDCGCS